MKGHKGFQKGHKINLGHSWNLGRKWTPEQREKLKGRTPWNKGLKGSVPWNKGKKGVQKSTRKGIKGLVNAGSFKKGHKHSPETIEKIRYSVGIKKGFITPIHRKIRVSAEYKLWRKAVFERDRFTCIWCYKKGGNIHADHIKPFAQYPELHFAIDNGRTLCVDCHLKTETYGNKLR